MKKETENLIDKIEEQLMKYSNGEIQIILKELELWALSDFIYFLIKEQLKELKLIK